MANRVSLTHEQQVELARAVQEQSARIGMDPVTMTTIMSYETVGTLDPAKKGPTTQWGQHEGLIQMGGPQRDQYGYDSKNNTISQNVEAVAEYLVDRGWQPGMTELDAYSIVNAGSPGLGHLTDQYNGGAKGTVSEKVASSDWAAYSKASADWLSEFGGQGWGVSPELAALAAMTGDDLSTLAAGNPAQINNAFDVFGPAMGLPDTVDVDGFPAMAADLSRSSIPGGKPAFETLDVDGRPAMSTDLSRAAVPSSKPSGGPLDVFAVGEEIDPFSAVDRDAPELARTGVTPELGFAPDGKTAQASSLEAAIAAPSVAAPAAQGRIDGAFAATDEVMGDRTAATMAVADAMDGKTGPDVNGRIDNAFDAALDGSTINDRIDQAFDFDVFDTAPATAATTVTAPQDGPELGIQATTQDPGQAAISAAVNDKDEAEEKDGPGWGAAAKGAVIGGATLGPVGVPLGAVAPFAWDAIKDGFQNFSNPLDGLFGLGNYEATPTGAGYSAAMNGGDFWDAYSAARGGSNLNAEMGRDFARTLAAEQAARSAQGQSTWGTAFSDALSELFGGGSKTGSAATNSGGKGGKGGSSGGKGGGKGGSSGKGGNQGDAGVGGADGGK